MPSMIEVSSISGDRISPYTNIYADAAGTDQESDRADHAADVARAAGRPLGEQ